MSSPEPPPPPPETILDPEAGTLSSLEVLIMLSAGALAVVLGILIVNIRVAQRALALRAIPRHRPGLGISATQVATATQARSTYSLPFFGTRASSERRLNDGSDQGHMGFRTKMANALEHSREVRSALVAALSLTSEQVRVVAAPPDDKTKKRGGGREGEKSAGRKRPRRRKGKDVTGSLSSDDSSYSADDTEWWEPSYDSDESASDRHHVPSVGGFSLMLDELHGYGSTPAARQLEQIAAPLQKRSNSRRRRAVATAAGVLDVAMQGGDRRSTSAFRPFEVNSLSWDNDTPATEDRRHGRRRSGSGGSSPGQSLRSWSSTRGDKQKQGGRRTHLRSTVTHSFPLLERIVRSAQPQLERNPARHFTVRDYCTALFDKLSALVGTRASTKDSRELLNRATFDRYCDWYELARFGQDELTLAQFAQFDRVYRALLDQLDIVLNWRALVDTPTSTSLV
jgi:hypothetical protein